MVNKEINERNKRDNIKKLAYVHVNVSSDLFDRSQSSGDTNLQIFFMNFFSNLRIILKQGK
jgi:hypothetical protein